MKISQFFNIVEIRTKIVSVSTILIATLYALYAYGNFELLKYVLLVISASCVDMGTTAFNTLFDY